LPTVTKLNEETKNFTVPTKHFFVNYVFSVPKSDIIYFLNYTVLHDTATIVTTES